MGNDDSGQRINKALLMAAQLASKSLPFYLSPLRRHFETNRLSFSNKMAVNTGKVLLLFVLLSGSMTVANAVRTLHLALSLT